MDILLKSIVASLLIGFGFVHSTFITDGQSRNRPPLSAIDVQRIPKDESPLIRYQAQEDTGYYKFGYAVADGQYRVEEGSPQEGVLGSYGYIGSDGKEVKVFYVADKRGFQILTAEAYKFLSEARKGYHYQDEPSNMPSEQDNLGFRDALDNFPTSEKPTLTTTTTTEDPFSALQPQKPPPSVFDYNMFNGRFPSSYPMFALPTKIPAHYLPKFRYENPFVERTFRFVSPENHRITTSLVIRVK